jgi:hypothetical protein
VRYEVGRLNRSRPAVLITHQYGDSVFPANQMVDLYNRLRGPKRLELAPGDHATAELPGLAGLPNHVWTSLRRWLDRYLRGVETGVDDGPGVVLRPHASSDVESYTAWPAVHARTERMALGPQTIRAGVDTPAGAGVALLSNGVEGLTGIPPLVWLPSVSRHDAGVWVSARYPTGTRLRGISTLHLAVTSAHPGGTLVAYLYDLDAAGLGRLLSHAPVSWRTAPGAVDLPMQVTAYDVPAGHRLALVVDTKDPLYADANGTGGTMTFGSASWLDLPER